jgi:DNA-binding IclR family transcriptional regulator
MFVVLDLCAASPAPLSLNDLVQRTGFPKSTLHRVCWKLVELGALENSERGFAIGAKLFALGSMSPELRRLRAMSMPYLHQLVVRTGWIANLGVLSGDRALVVDEVFGAGPPLPRMLGATLPLHASALGKALLAGCPVEQQEQLASEIVLRPYTGHTIVRQDRLRRQLELAARTGIAYSRQEWRIGTSGVASPVMADGEPLAALALVGPHRESSLRPNGQAVSLAARRLGEALERSRLPVPA